MKPDGMRNWIGALVILAVLAMCVAAILAVSGCESPTAPDAQRAYEAKRCTDAGLVVVPSNGRTYCLVPVSAGESR